MQVIINEVFLSEQSLASLQPWSFFPLCGQLVSVRLAVIGCLIVTPNNNLHSQTTAASTEGISLNVRYLYWCFHMKKSRFL